MTQEVEPIPSKHKTLSSTSSTAKEKKKKTYLKELPCEVN
jgi:hypothetical protein